MKNRLAMISLTVLVVAAGSLTSLAGTKNALVLKPEPMATTSQNNHEHQQKKTENEAALAKEAKIKLEEAREIALKRAPGKVESENLEREHGKLVYSFDIRTGKEITEVQVSALNGKIVRVDKETPAQEAAEKRKEERTKASHKAKQ